MQGTLPQRISHAPHNFWVSWQTFVRWKTYIHACDYPSPDPNSETQTQILKKMFAVLIYTDRYYSISHITCSLLFIFLFLYRIVFVCFDLQDLSSLTRDWTWATRLPGNSPIQNSFNLFAILTSLKLKWIHCKSWSTHEWYEHLCIEKHYFHFLFLL